MTNSSSHRPQVFIEKIMPVKLLNEQVYYEHGGNPFKGLHRWYSRKPLSFSRASVLASLLPGDVTMEEFKYLLGLYPEQEGLKPDPDIKLYKTPPGKLRIKKVQDYCEKLWGTRTPTVLDAFAGGGSIPFEAARYGFNVLASDLNPVAVVTMKAAMEYPLKFGPDLQQDIDQWVKWVGDEAEKRLAEFFPSLPGETVQNYLWAHTVVCPNCESVVPLSPNWWLYKRPEKQNLHKWCAVKPIPNPENKRVDFELVKGKKGKGTTIQTDDGEYDPDTTTTIGRGVGRCPNCDNVIEDDVIKSQALAGNFRHHLYAVAYRKGKASLDFRIPTQIDIDGINKVVIYLNEKLDYLKASGILPVEERFDGFSDRCIAYGLAKSLDYFNSRQLLTLVTYLEIINEAKSLIQDECEEEKETVIAKLKSNPEVEDIQRAIANIELYYQNKVEAIATYLGLVLDRCADTNCRLAHWDSSRAGSKTASAQHSLNLMWNYPEISGKGELWNSCADAFASDYQNLCNLLGTEDNRILFNLNFVGQASSLSITNDHNKLATHNNNLVINGSLIVNDDGGNVGQDARPTRNDDDEIYLNPNLKITYSNWGTLPHWELNGSIYFITFNTIERIELTLEARQIVLDACRFFNDQRYQLYCAVVMPDHVHLLLEPLSKNEGEYWTSANILHSIKSYTAKQISKVMNHIGTVWQDRRYDRIIRDEREFFNTWEYIRQNPVKASLSLTPEDYVFLWQSQIVGQASSLSIAETNEQLLTNNDLFEDRGNVIGNVGQDARPTRTNSLEIFSASADNLSHISDNSVDVIITDPPYYATIQYAELSDFFYVWQKRTLGDIFPDLFWMELTDKDREAVANPSRFRNMGVSPEELANQDYEAKMAMAFAEYHRVLREDGVMTVQFNHKESGAWDTLAYSLINAGFEITASWSVSTENPQNLHQAQKNSVASTVLLVCRKRDPNAEQAWWDDLRPEVSNLVEQRAPEFEDNDIQGIDLYLSAFGPALNVFSRSWPVLDSTGNEVRPEVAFAEARKAVANYRFRKLAQTDTMGFDPVSQWYFLAWDAFRAREFPFDDARQLALAVGGFNVADLGKSYKILDIKSGTCKFLSPEQRYKKHAFSIVDNEFSAHYLIDGLHTIIAIYQQEQTIEPIRRFMKATELITNDRFMRAWEIALKVIPRIGDERKRIPEEKALLNLWLAMDEIKAKVVYVQQELLLEPGQLTLDLKSVIDEDK